MAFRPAVGDLAGANPVRRGPTADSVNAGKTLIIAAALPLGFINGRENNRRCTSIFAYGVTRGTGKNLASSRLQPE